MLVRDAILSEESRREMQEAIKLGKSYVEVKTENIIDRNVGTAKHPRQQERVPAGAKFDLEIAVQIFDLDRGHDIIGEVKKALKSIQDSYLGGSGSRGYGKVKFLELTLDGEPFQF
jgi:CRISPR-associated protein Csm3